MKISDLTFDSILNATSQVYHYLIPNYQREYSWKKEHWETLLDDLYENPPGHFMGSIICLKKETCHGCDQYYEIVDGQQRMITLSLLLMAIYKKFANNADSDLDNDEEFVITKSQIRSYLIHTKKNPYEEELEPIVDDGKTKFLRVRPSSQNENYADYLYLLYEVGLLTDQPDYPKNMGNRRIKKTYRFFLKQISNDRDELKGLLEKVQNIFLIHISADNPSMAYKMFETLNNRGLPLTPIDIIKNQMLSKLSETQNGSFNDDYAFKQWKKLIANLNEEVQIRFFRQYYNIYQFDDIGLVKHDGGPLIKTEGIKKATQSNLTLTFKNAIQENAKALLNDLIKKSIAYKFLIHPKHHNNSDYEKLNNYLKDLKRVRAATSYASLLLLWEKNCYHSLQDFEKIVDLYVKYYVRRNVTDIPPTRDLDTIQIQLCNRIFQKLRNSKKITYDWFKSNLLSLANYSSLEQFESNLYGPIYTDNREMARFILIKIEETQFSREYKPDLWERANNDKFIWTIEHVLPQADKLNDDWVKMIANDNKEKAEDIQAEYVHKLGNLTLSGYNSNLADAQLSKKQQKQTINIAKKKVDIGYRNGLYLNEIEYLVDDKKYSLANTPVWNEKHIKSRTEEIDKKAIELFKFDDE